MALSFAAIIQSLQCLKLMKRLVITIFRRLLQQRTFHKCMQRGPVILLTLDAKTKSTLRNIVCSDKATVDDARGGLHTHPRTHAFFTSAMAGGYFYSLWRVDIMRILSLIIMVINTSPERRMQNETHWVLVSIHVARALSLTSPSACWLFFSYNVRNATHQN
jgi:hypothetical protein